MIKTHKTADGTKMLVAEMEDSHLLNTVKMHLRNAVTAKGRVNAAPVSEFARNLYGAQTDPAEAAAMVRQIMEKVEPYVAEMWLRDIGHELRPTFLALLERETVPQLAMGDDVPF